MTEAPSEPEADGAEKWNAVAVLGIAALLCHGLMLLSDYRIWDGWLIEDWQRNSAFDFMWRQYSEAGILHHYLIHRFFAEFAARLWLYKAVSFVAYVAIAVAARVALTRSGFVSKRTATLIAGGMICVPGMLTVGEAALLPYLLGECAFFGGAACAFISERNEGLRRGLFRIAALLLLFAGLTYYALVVYYLAFYLLLLWFLWRRYEVTDWRSMVPLVLRRIDYLLVPPVFWVLRGILMPTHGDYAGYNTPELNFANFAEAYGSLFTRYLPGHLGEMVVNPVVVAMIVGAGVFWARRQAFWRPDSWRQVRVLAGVGVFLVVLGCFPYAAVKRTFEASGYGSNAAQLIPIGGAFLLTALLGTVRLAFPRDRQGAAAAIVCLYLLVSFAGIWTSNSLHWQAVAARERSIFGKLASDPVAKTVSVFYFVDSAPVPRTDIYVPAISSVQVQQAFNDRTRIGFPTKWYPDLIFPAAVLPEELQKTLNETRMPYYFRQANLKGRQAYVTINSGRDHATPEEIAWRDLTLKFTGRRGSKEDQEFLERMTDVAVLPVTL